LFHANPTDNHCMTQDAKLLRKNLNAAEWQIIGDLCTAFISTPLTKSKRAARFVDLDKMLHTYRALFGRRFPRERAIDLLRRSAMFSVKLRPRGRMIVSFNFLESPRKTAAANSGKS